tara:strand:- start:6326 stop:7186 length:861 start_codon:yes stop_codon:yes gene_type:complete
MNILFLGGNRYFGKLVLKKLLNKNHNIFLVNRNSKEEKIKHKNLIHIKCERKNIKNYKNLIKGIVFDKVFDNIAYKLEDVKNLHSILKNKIKHYIFTSSAITYFDFNDGYEAKEEDWPRGRLSKKFLKKHTKYEINYAINKRKIENYLIKNKKIISTILRIPSVIGKNDFSNKTQKLINFNYDFTKNKNFGNQFIQFISKDDLVKIILKIINSKPNKREQYNIANDKIKIKNFYYSILKRRNLKKKYAHFSNTKFPIPINKLMNCSKIKKKFKLKISPSNTILKVI